MRDKLIEMIQNAVDGCSSYWAGLISDYLIAHGVTLATETNVGGKTPITNGDRIRAMTDEELADFLNRVKQPCDNCQLAVFEGACTETLCDDAMENWLKQPVEEVTCIQSDM